MRKICLIILIMVMCIPMVFSETPGGAGVKIWFVSDEDDASGVMLGPTGYLDFQDDFWLSVMYLTGSIEKSDWESESQDDAEFVFGRSWEHVDAGVGVRHVTLELDNMSYYDNEFSSYGPMLYVGTGNSFAETAFGWYGGLSWMIADVSKETVTGGDMVGLEHYTIEAGVFYTLEDVQMTMGYRHKAYLDSEFSDHTYSGLTLAGTYSF